MADPKIRLKRSSVQGKIPTAENVPLGELALNTYDGYLYASKNVGVGTTVIAVNPWRVGTGTDYYDINFTAGNVGINSESPTAKLDVNGDVNISGVITATSFVGDGSGLTNLPGGGGSIAGISTTGTSYFNDISIEGISTLGFFSDDQIIAQNATLGENTTYYSVHKNINIESGATLTVGSGSTILLDRFNNLDDVTATSLDVQGDINAQSVASPFIMSYNRIRENFTVPENYNAMSIGPILSVDDGITITVESNSYWSIIPAS